MMPTVTAQPFAQRRVRALLLLSVVAGLLGCGPSKEEELRDWMAQEKSQNRTKLPAPAAPVLFQPEPYTQGQAADPFDSRKLTQALQRDVSLQTNSALVAPELKRRKDPLEAFSLDTMRMVGHIAKPGQPMALIQADRQLYQVKVGEHVGQNYGRISKITETAVHLREIVQDAAGQWTERTVVLELQEKTK